MISSSNASSSSSSSSQKPSKNRQEDCSQELSMFFHRPEEKRKEINIPADENCLYTTIFVGYLVPVLNNKALFSKRLKNLLGYSSSNTENIRAHLFRDMRDPNELRNFSLLIEEFKTHMGLQNSVWGGVKEIQILANKLNITVQEIVEVDFVSDVPPIIAQNQKPNPEIIYLRRCIPNSEECECVDPEDKEDPSLQVAQYESAVDNKSFQHFRLVKNPADKKINKDYPSSIAHKKEQKLIEELASNDPLLTKISLLNYLEESFSGSRKQNEASFILDPLNDDLILQLSEALNNNTYVKEIEIVLTSHSFYNVNH
jgi:hypothetical protein